MFHVRVPGLETHLLPNSSYLLMKSLGSITDDSSSSMGHSRWKPGWNSWLLDLAWFRSGCCMLLEMKQGMEPFSAIIFLYPFQVNHFIYIKNVTWDTWDNWIEFLTLSFSHKHYYSSLGSESVIGSSHSLSLSFFLSQVKYTNKLLKE